MAYDVHLHVSFEVVDREKLIQIAQRCEHLLTGTLSPEQSSSVSREALWFLHDLQIPDRCIFWGGKGDLCLWGGVFNYAHVDGFVSDLEDFWKEIYAQEAVFSFSRLMVFWEAEQTEHANVIEISCSNCEFSPIGRRDENSPVLETHKYEGLAFSWQQA